MVGKVKNAQHWHGWKSVLRSSSDQQRRAETEVARHSPNKALLDKIGRSTLVVTRTGRFMARLVLWGMSSPSHAELGMLRHGGIRR